MIKAAVVMVGLALVGVSQAKNNPDEPISHGITIKGLQAGEGRYLRVDITENEHTKFGYYFCVNQTAYYSEKFYSPSDEPYHREHLIKLSLCQDETLTQCQEIGTDKYLTFRNADGYLENDVSTVSFDISAIKNSFQACVPESDIDLDDMISKSLHLNDRRFSQVG